MGKRKFAISTDDYDVQNLERIEKEEAKIPVEGPVKAPVETPVEAPAAPSVAETSAAQVEKKPADEKKTPRKRGRKATAAATVPENTVISVEKVQTPGVLPVPAARTQLVPEAAPVLTEVAEEAPAEASPTMIAESYIKTAESAASMPVEATAIPATTAATPAATVMSKPVAPGPAPEAVAAMPVAAETAPVATSGPVAVPEANVGAASAATTPTPLTKVDHPVTRMVRDPKDCVGYEGRKKGRVLKKRLISLTEENEAYLEEEHWNRRISSVGQFINDIIKEYRESDKGYVNR